MDLERPENSFLDVIVKEEYTVEDIPENIEQNQWKENPPEEPEDVKNVILLENKPQESKNVDRNECKCSICGKFYANRYTLKTHMETHSKKKGSSYCPYCKKGLKKKTRLQAHLKACHECHVCNLMFKTKLEKASHIEQEHKNEKLNNIQSLGHKKSFPCDKCGRIFVYEKPLTYHVARSKDCQDESLTCSICSQSFDELFNLTTHVREMHTPEILSICSFCGMSFISSDHLNKHLLTHKKTDKKTYKCRHCNQEFSSRDECIAHRKNFHFFVHSRVRPKPKHRRKKFQCPYCLKTYASKDYFVNHVKSHQEHYEGNSTFKFPQEELSKCEFCSREIRGHHNKLMRHKRRCFSKRYVKNPMSNIKNNLIEEKYGLGSQHIPHNYPESVTQEALGGRSTTNPVVTIDLEDDSDEYILS